MSVIQWYPGHMAKANRELKKALPKIDLVIELLDARIPLASRNPLFEQTLANKKRLLLLNKSDLADPIATKKWVAYYKEKGLLAIPYNSIKRQQVNSLIKTCLNLGSKPNQSRFKPVHLVIIGIPNVGKSQLINQLANRQIARVQNRPAITQQQQWIPIGTQLTLLDTPGILWPKFDETEIGYRLALSGAIKDSITDFADAIQYLVSHLKTHYLNEVNSYFQTRFSAQDENHLIIEKIGEKRGLLEPGGHINEEGTYRHLIQAYRKGKIGRISLEFP